MNEQQQHGQGQPGFLGAAVTAGQPGGTTITPASPATPAAGPATPKKGHAAASRFGEEHFARSMHDLQAAALGDGSLIKLIIQLGGAPAVQSLIQLLFSKIMGGGTPAQAMAAPGLPAGAWDTLVNLATRIAAIGKPFALQFVQALVQELIVQELQGAGAGGSQGGAAAAVPAE